jgi:hypothetical protein
MTLNAPIYDSLPAGVVVPLIVVGLATRIFGRESARRIAYWLIRTLIGGAIALPDGRDEKNA